jgi:ribonuclease III
MSSATQSLEQTLGHSFADPSLLTRALTHRSFGVPHNERLEFLGDGLLNLAIANLLYQKFPNMPEGDLSRLRANLVNQAVLAQIATDLHLGAAIRLGEGEIKTGGANRPSILADALESLIGAVFVDAGFDAAHAFVTRLFAQHIDNPLALAPTKDAKTQLQEFLQSKHYPLPQYMVKRIEGAAHQQTFFVECITERPAHKVEGVGSTRRIAEQDAASKVLAKLDKVDKHNEQNVPA